MAWHRIGDKPLPEAKVTNFHYNGVIMSTMASHQPPAIVDSTVYSRRTSKKTSQLRVTGLCEGNSPVTGEFPAQGPETRKMFPFDDVIMSDIIYGDTRDNRMNLPEQPGMNTRCFISLCFLYAHRHWLSRHGSPLHKLVLCLAGQYRLLPYPHNLRQCIQWTIRWYGMYHP